MIRKRAPKEKVKRQIRFCCDTKHEQTLAPVKSSLLIRDLIQPKGGIFHKNVRN